MTKQYFLYFKLLILLDHHLNKIKNKIVFFYININIDIIYKTAITYMIKFFFLTK